MTPVLVDSNVLLDIATNDPTWCAWSEAALSRAAGESLLVINPLIYAEVSVAYTRIEDVENVLPSSVFRREQLPYEAAFLAGKAFLRYRRRAGAHRAPLPDFYVGAHAAVAGLRLLTRDAARYKTYFPTVTLISPE